MVAGQLTNDGYYTFSLAGMTKGLWSNRSTFSVPEGFVTQVDNFDLTGGIFTAMNGNADFISTAWPNDSGVPTLLTYHKTAAGVVTYLLATTAGIVYKWNSSGASWDKLRQGLSTTSTLWWSAVRYGTDLYISNATDGIYRYDGDTLVPVGSRAVAQAESDEASLWTGETASTAEFREGLQSMYAESAGADATLTWTPASAIDLSTARGSARAYLFNKTTGTDYFHFKVMFSNTGTVDTASTKVLFTTSGGNTLAFALTLWDSDRSGTAFTTTPVDGTWYDVYLKGTDGSQTGTWNPASCTSIAFTVDTSAGTRRMHIDDCYMIYATTMPAVNYLAEWRNMLWGATPTVLYFSPENAADEWNSLANTSIKSNGELITGLKTFFNQLTITTESQVFSISGQVGGFAYPGYLFDQNMVTDEVGCSSHRSMVKAADKLYWWFNSFVVEYNGTSAPKISHQIDATLQTVETDSPQYMVGAPFRQKDQVWWTWRRDGQTTNDRVLRYDYHYKAFLNTTGLATPLICQVIDGGVEYLLTLDATNRKVKKEGQSAVFTFHGTNIDYTLEFPPMMVAGEVVEWDRLEVFYLSNSGSFAVQFRESDHLRGLSGASYSTLETITMSTDGEYGVVRIGRRSQIGQIKLTATAALLELEMPILIKAFPVNDPQLRVTP